MKKILAFLSILFLPFLFFGCSTTDIVTRASETANTYEIVATLDNENKTLSASMTLSYTNQSASTFEFIYFHLHPNAFSEGASTNYAVSQTQAERAYDNGVSYGGIEILSTKQNGEDTNFSVEGADDHLLKVDLSNALKSGDMTEIEIDFQLTIPNVNHRFGYGKHTINLGNWYPSVCVFEGEEWNTEGYLPSGDPFYNQIANYVVTLTYDSNLTLASSGELQSSTSENGKTTDVYQALAIRDFAMVLSSEFDVISTQVDDVTINYFYFEDENAQAHLQTAVDALETFNDLIGEYPYNVLNVVKACFLHGGMEYSNLVYISDQVTNEAEYNNVIIHEIAHQWWYGVVGNNQIKYGFIDEGLAEYSTALFYDLNEEYGQTTSEVIGNALSSYLLFCDVYGEVYGNLDSSMNRPISTFNTETEYVYLTYVKGVLMFDSIAEVIGQNKMEKCLQALYEKYAMQEITPTQMIETFSKTSGRKIESYIASWLDGTVILEELSA